MPHNAHVGFLRKWEWPSAVSGKREKPKTTKQNTLVVARELCLLYTVPWPDVVPPTDLPSPHHRDLVRTSVCPVQVSCDAWLL